MTWFFSLGVGKPISRLWNNSCRHLSDSAYYVSDSMLGTLHIFKKHFYWEIIHIYNSPYLKYTVQWFLIYSQICTAVTTNRRIFSSLQKERLYSLAITSYSVIPLPPHRQSLICFLCPWVRLFWAFVWIGIIICKLLYLAS